MYLSELTVAASVHSLVTRMALNALKRRDISKIDRMFEGLAGLVARLTFPFCQGTQIDRMLERRRLRRGTGIRRVSQNGVTNVAVVSDYFAGVTYVFAVVDNENNRWSRSGRCYRGVPPNPSSSPGRSRSGRFAALQ